MAVSNFKNFNAGVPKLWSLMADDLRWCWCNYNRNKVRNKCKVFESSPNSPHPPIPDPWKIVLHETIPWCQKVGGCCFKVQITKCSYESKMRYVGSGEHIVHTNDRRHLLNVYHVPGSLLNFTLICLFNSHTKQWHRHNYYVKKFRNKK